MNKTFSLLENFLKWKPFSICETAHSTCAKGFHFRMFLQVQFSVSQRADQSSTFICSVSTPAPIRFLNIQFGWKKKIGSKLVNAGYPASCKMKFRSEFHSVNDWTRKSTIRILIVDISVPKQQSATTAPFSSTLNGDEDDLVRL